MLQRSMSVPFAKRGMHTLLRTSVVSYTDLSAAKVARSGTRRGGHVNLLRNLASLERGAGKKSGRTNGRLSGRTIYEFSSPIPGAREPSLAADTRPCILRNN